MDELKPDDLFNMFYIGALIRFLTGVDFTWHYNMVEKKLFVTII